MIKKKKRQLKSSMFKNAFGHLIAVNKSRFKTCGIPPFKFLSANDQ